MKLFTETTNKKKISNNLITIYNELDMNNDTIQAQKIIDLINKLEKQELVIGFAGHFSAGKSTMINQLIGEDILPSSPIPTSANVVKVRSGEAYTRVFYSESQPIEYKGIHDLETIKALCKDGDSIKGLEISKPISTLPDNVTIMDTPGIDSSNDADRIITESSLHLVDVLFYVMDYNHVQSEVNLAFLREMQEKGKQCYIIINQIDKHENNELSFSDFQQSVQVALDNWNVYPKGIFYTSLKDYNHEHNQYNDVKKLFINLTKKREERIEETVIHSATSVINDHITFVKNSKQETIDNLNEQLEQLQVTDNQNSYSSSEIDKKAKALKNKVKDVEINYKQKLDSILKNAYLMPFENREKARAFLESQQPQFKAGLLFTKKKTEQLKMERLREFYDALMDTVTAQLEWHVRDLLLNLSKQCDISDIEFLNQIQNYTIKYRTENLIKLVKSGAQVTGDYVLVYTNDVVDDIKSFVKADCNAFWKTMWKTINHNTQSEAKEMEIALNQAQDIEKIQEQLKEIQVKVDNRQKELTNLLFNSVEVTEEEISKVHQKIQMQAHNIQVSTEINIHSNEIEKNKNDEIGESSNNSTLLDISTEEALEKIKASEQLLKEIKGFTTIANELKRKREKLKNRHFTVALFGAFSAGKSSFANALLGENVLPVSPNPTTATINKISPPTSNHSHGDVVVKFKSEAQLIADIQHVTTNMPEKLTSLAEIIKWMRIQNLSDYVQETGTKNLSFLIALKDGYEKVKDKLGQENVIGLKESKDFIAQEDKACFVEWLEIYYDCAFTQNGITLVDTPGADSVNARHTDVAFEYIKDADAILFVTYYNHAFSRADREFLIQLGRVKDVFSLDKMFFIINASDLSKDKEELQLVTSYVKNQLNQFGIRNPRMHALSSKLALAEKLNRSDESKSSIFHFEQNFNNFIQKELTGLFIQSALYDLERAVNMLAEYIKSAALNKDEKLKMKKKYLQDQQETKSQIEGYEDKRFKQSIEQEIHELTYYIHQRVFLRFSEIFKESFNPSTIRSNGKKGNQELVIAFKELIAFIQHDLIQEIQATSLRVETFMKKCIQELSKGIENIELFKQYQLTFSDQMEMKFETPQITIDVSELEYPNLNKTLSIFKNTKAFFEENEKEKMKEDLQKHLMPIVKAILNKKESELLDIYLKQWHTEMTKMKQNMSISVDEYFEGLLYNVSDRIDVNHLHSVHEKIKSYVIK